MQVILLDIEGTTSSIRFVHEVMFPFARRELPQYLENHWEYAEFQDARQQIAIDAGAESWEAWSGDRSTDQQKQLVIEEIERLMDGDVKATGLKQLQGLIWRAGFESGELQAHLYDDVAPAIRRWKEAGKQVRIYSSGSIAAQKLFFGHTLHGDLLPLLDGHYDTTSGPKKEAESYRRIVADIGVPAGEILFLSDIAAELDAAREVGLQTGLSVRPGNGETPAGHGHPEWTSFEGI